MDRSLAAVAEKLAYEFGELRNSAVISVLSACVDEYPYDGPHFIEQAARARLMRLGRPQSGWPTIPARDSLDVSLHDSELADELELTARLMVATNESEHALGQEEVDRILGLSLCLPAIPRQAFPVQAKPRYQQLHGLA